LTNLQKFSPKTIECNYFYSIAGGVFMFPTFVSHSDYQDVFASRFLDLFPDPFGIPKESWNIINQFFHLDLSETHSVLFDTYSAKGPSPRPPSCLLRSYLLMIKTGEVSISKWCNTLRLNPLYSILSGFAVDDSPGIGTFYDFFSRCWGSESDNTFPHERPPKKKVSKGKKAGEKTPIDTSTVSERLFAFFDKHPIKEPKNPFALILKLYTTQFLHVSHDKGFIDLDHLSLAGDGTPVVTSARMRRKTLCDCSSKGIHNCKCKRNYSQPDCDIGWDSSRLKYFNGYHLYIFVASNSFNDLPVFPMLEPASRHDLPSFIHTLFTMQAWLPQLNIEKLILDSAHDAMPVYEYCLNNQITPLIDLNTRKLGHFTYKDSFTIDEDGVPICREGLRMHRNGVERSKYRSKFRCPQATRKRGCFCDNPCSDAKFGRAIHTNLKDNPRLFCIPPRGSKEWKNEFARRSTSERSNKRQKIDYKLEDGKHRSSKMWYCRLYAIMMLQHLDAWEMPSIEAFQNIFVKQNA
jgi:hypothetical protein